jgi:hypothetical protein
VTPDREQRLEDALRDALYPFSAVARDELLARHGLEGMLLLDVPGSEVGP